MKAVNLVTFVAVIFFAAFVNWLVLQLFPWYSVSDDIVDQVFSAAVSWEKANPPVTITGPELGYYRDDLRSIVEIHNVGQHIVAYLLAGCLSMLTIRYGEKQLFPRQANVNWKLAIPMWLVPMGYLAVDSTHGFVLFANWVMIAFIGGYAFAYQAVGAFSRARRTEPTR